MNTLTFSFSVICMHDVMEDSRLNSTHWFSQTTEKSIIFSGAAIDGLIGLLPSVPLISYFGFKSVLVFYGIISSLGTFMFPMVSLLWILHLLIMPYSTRIRIRYHVYSSWSGARYLGTEE